jgi:hypothetical protein
LTGYHLRGQNLTKFKQELDLKIKDNIRERSEEEKNERKKTGTFSIQTNPGGLIK